MNIVFLFGLLVCGSGYTTNKEKLAKNNFYVNTSVAILESGGMTKARATMKTLMMIEAAKLQEAISESRIEDVCETNRGTGKELAVTPTVSPTRNTKGNKFWKGLEFFYWMMTISAACITIGLMHYNAISDTEGSTSVFTPLNVECYQPLTNVLAWFKETDLTTYEDPCELESVTDCEPGQVSPLRIFTRCVMDNMNSIVQRQRDLLIAITALTRVHGLVDNVATHANIQNSAEQIQKELAEDSKEDAEHDWDMVNKVCFLMDKAKEFGEKFNTDYNELMQM